MSRRHYINYAPQRTLASSITSGVVTGTVSGTFAGWPTQFPFTAELDRDTASAETVLITNIVGSVATWTRGYDSTAAISHAAGATLDFVVSAIDFDEANNHVNLSAGVHGVSGSVVGTTDVQTVSNKTLTATGDVTAAANKKITGVHVAASYTNEAAATAGAVNVAGAVVYLSAPTGGPVGHYAWDVAAAAWKHIPVVGEIGFVGEANNAGTVALPTAATDVAGLATVTFTLSKQTRVKISTIARFKPSVAGSIEYHIQSGYNAGASAVIGSVAKVGQPFYASEESTVREKSGHGLGTVLLAAGTFTAYAAVNRGGGGAAADVAGEFYTLVEAIGNV